MAETIGLIASVIQVAGAGLKLSQTLYQYADGVATADRRIKDIAKEIQLTSFVIEELGDVFKHDETSTLMSKNAVKTANETMKECSSVFAEIDATLKKSKKNTFGRLMLPFRDNKIELLRNHIDKLKSTLQLLMQVLTHAHQVATNKLDREAEAKQKAQIQELIELEKNSAKKYEESLRSFSFSDSSTMFDDIEEATPNSKDPENGSPRDVPVAVATLGRSITLETLGTCVQHIRSLLENIEALQQALSAEIEGDDHSEHHQNLIGSYFQARGHLDSVLFSGSHGHSIDPTTSDKEKLAQGQVIQTNNTTDNITPNTSSPAGSFGKSRIYFRDARGLKFSSFLRACNTWEGLRNWIERIYAHRGQCGEATKGHFDVLDSEGYAIMPEDWQDLVEPEMSFTLRFWIDDNAATADSSETHSDQSRTADNKKSSIKFCNPHSRLQPESSARDEQLRRPGAKSQQVSGESSVAPQSEVHGRQPASELNDAGADSVASMLREDVNKMLQRGDRLDNLPDKSDPLVASAVGFRRGQKKQPSNGYWSNPLTWFTPSSSSAAVSAQINPPFVHREEHNKLANEEGVERVKVDERQHPEVVQTHQPGDALAALPTFPTREAEIELFESITSGKERNQTVEEREKETAALRLQGTKIGDTKRTPLRRKISSHHRTPRTYPPGSTEPMLYSGIDMCISDDEADSDENKSIHDVSSVAKPVPAPQDEVDALLNEWTTIFSAEQHGSKAD